MFTEQMYKWHVIMCSNIAIDMMITMHFFPQNVSKFRIFVQKLGACMWENIHKNVFAPSLPLSVTRDVPFA